MQITSDFEAFGRACSVGLGDGSVDGQHGRVGLDDGVEFRDAGQGGAHRNEQCGITLSNRGVLAAHESVCDLDLSRRVA